MSSCRADSFISRHRYFTNPRGDLDFSLRASTRQETKGQGQTLSNRRCSENYGELAWSPTVLLVLDTCISDHSSVMANSAPTKITTTTYNVQCSPLLKCSPSSLPLVCQVTASGSAQIQLIVCKVGPKQWDIYIIFSSADSLAAKGAWQRGQTVWQWSSATRLRCAHCSQTFASSESPIDLFKKAITHTHTKQFVRKTTRKSRQFLCKKSQPPTCNTNIECMF